MSLFDFYGGSPRGNELRRRATEIEALAVRTDDMASRVHNLRSSTGAAIRGFPFEGPLARAVKGSIDRQTKMIDVVADQLRGAGKAAVLEAMKLREAARHEDRAWHARQEQQRRERAGS